MTLDARLDQPLSALVSPKKKNGSRQRATGFYYDFPRDSLGTKKRQRSRSYMERCPSVSRTDNFDACAGDSSTVDELATLKKRRAEKFGFNEPSDQLPRDVSFKKSYQPSGSSTGRAKLDCSLDELLEESEPVYRRKEFDPTANERPESLHVYGAHRLSREDAAEVFSNFDLHHIEWLDKSSFNAVFNDPEAAAEALTTLATTVVQDEPWWQLSPENLEPFPACKNLLVRLATDADSVTPKKPYPRQRTYDRSIRRGYITQNQFNNKNQFQPFNNRHTPTYRKAKEYFNFDELEAPEDIGHYGTDTSKWGDVRCDIMDKSRIQILGEELGME